MILAKRQKEILGLKPILIPSAQVEIRGVVVAVIRKYERGGPCL